MFLLRYLTAFTEKQSSGAKGASQSSCFFATFWPSCTRVVPSISPNNVDSHAYEANLHARPITRIGCQRLTNINCSMGNWKNARETIMAALKSSNKRITGQFNVHDVATPTRHGSPISRCRHGSPISRCKIGIPGIATKKPVLNHIGDHQSSSSVDGSGLKSPQRIRYNARRTNQR